MITFEFTKIIGDVKAGKDVLIDDFVFIGRGKIILGNNIHISSFASITGGGILEVDDFVGISSGVRVLTGTDDFVSRGFGNPTIPDVYRNVKRHKVKIGKFSVIGANAVILPGVEIGVGCSVAAGTVISKSLKPWGIYAKNRRIGERDRAGILKNYEKYKNN